MRIETEPLLQPPPRPPQPLKYSHDGKVCFDPARHTYCMGDKMLKGVTGYISKFKHYFDSDTIAEAYALKHWMRKEDVLALWKAKADLSIIKGHAVHGVFETYSDTGKIVLPGISHKEAVAVQFIRDFYETGRLTPIESEMIVYNDFLASQIDQTARSKAGQKFILDWKTNSKIEYTSWNDRRMLSPFEAYPDCSFYHYSIQVAIYRHLDPESVQAWIVHIGDTNYTLIKPAEIKLPAEFYTTV